MTSEITLDQLLSHLEYMNKRGVDKLNIEDVIAMIKMIRLTDESL
jgi:hypothetical protein